MKRVLVFLAVLLFLLSVNINRAIADCWYWTIEDNGNVLLKGHTPTTSTHLTVPERYYPSLSVRAEMISVFQAQAAIGVPGMAALIQGLKANLGLPVRVILDHAFENYPDLEYVYLPEGIQSIGAYAFWGCPSLTAIRIPDSVTTIGEECFGGSPGRVTITASYGSVAWQYAMDNGHAFEEASGEEPGDAASRLPDLLVERILNTTNQKDWRVGHAVQFDSSVWNAGPTGTQTGFNIKWFVNGEQMGYGYHEAIPASQTVDNGNSQFSFVPKEPGQYQIVFQVDSDDHIAESDEENNEMSIWLSVIS
ncbi:MAG: leucine-rich repeat protein [Clostridiales bacterium]|nr:leucine-rich repeat protein [Clostridiales bacterium]